jgi:hypothetical protein
MMAFFKGEPFGDFYEAIRAIPCVIGPQKQDGCVSPAPLRGAFHVSRRGASFVQDAPSPCPRLQCRQLFPREHLDS